LNAEPAGVFKFFFFFSFLKRIFLFFKLLHFLFVFIFIIYSPNPPSLFQCLFLFWKSRGPTLLQRGGPSSSFWRAARYLHLRRVKSMMGLKYSQVYT
jgi:hypothetical protein